MPTGVTPATTTAPPPARPHCPGGAGREPERLERLARLPPAGVEPGFSGEGELLEALATDTAAEDAELISVLPAWEPRIDPADLAEQSGLPVERVRAALTRLGTAGRVGYDIAEAACFHRELPYDARRAERHNPRLAAARALLETGAVTLDPPHGAVVASGERRYRARESGGALSCTCQWWADHRGRRGPCKHALATRMALRAATAAPAAPSASGACAASAASA